MTISKLIKPTKLFEYFDSEVKESLARHGLKRLFDYAWIGEDVPSPQYIGLAKWSQDGLCLHTYETGSEIFYRRESFESLMTICADLEALMEISRLSIGNTLWMSDIAKADTFDHNHYFWLNHINSLTLLEMASDRVRDLFLRVHFDCDYFSYKNKNKCRKVTLSEEQKPLSSNHYQYAFQDALQSDNSSAISLVLDELCRLVKNIYEFREERNVSVHEVATLAAKLTKRQFQDRNGLSADLSNLSHADITSRWDNAVRNNVEMIDSALNGVADWYRDLSLAASSIFNIEHFRRRVIGAK